ncbi:uncharacterized protein LOC114575422 [Exaiptasia diaphana]|uniref:Uncharacterized protein n=1 Tax=Exaiptasia diaphana TaxID=2652724 RepID=A0A913YNG6_EXADI|nr:uncharacterized protein LOC114575422 [Exaiptasia diaphana]
MSRHTVNSRSAALSAIPGADLDETVLRTEGISPTNGDPGTKAPSFTGLSEELKAAIQAAATEAALAAVRASSAVVSAPAPPPTSSPASSSVNGAQDLNATANGLLAGGYSVGMMPAW